MPGADSRHAVPAREWTDDDGEPLGVWVEIGLEEWRDTIESVGSGIDALQVFSTLTDPDGTYGEPRIYTAFGRRDDDAPLVDICDFKDPKRRVYRRFVRTTEL
jgi:hypothetical protein